MKNGKNQYKLILLWLIVCSFPFFSIFTVASYTWVPSFVSGFRAIGIVSNSITFVLLFILIRKSWKKYTKIGARIAIVVVWFLTSLYHFLCLYAVVRFDHSYEKAVDVIELQLPAGNHTFYIANESSLTYLFDGGFSVWVEKEGAWFVEKIGPVIWKSEYTGDYTVSGNKVVFFFHDDNPFSHRGSGETFIEYHAGQ